MVKTWITRAVQYYEALLSPSLAPKAENTNKDISSLIEDEVADLKDPEKQVFTYHKLGINGLVYLIMASDAPGECLQATNEPLGAVVLQPRGNTECLHSSGPGPVEVVQAMAEDVQKTRQCRARLCIRFTPVEAVCYAKLEDMTQAASTVVNPHFPDGEDAEPLSYAVHYEHRASLNLDRLKVINAVIHGIPKVRRSRASNCYSANFEMLRCTDQSYSLPCSRRTRLI